MNMPIAPLKPFLLGILSLWLYHASAVDHFDLKLCRDKAVYYFAEHDITKGDPELKFAVIYIHGFNGGARDAASSLRQKLQQFKKDEKVLSIAPSFFTAKSCPKNRLGTAMLWDGGWRGGAAALNGSKISNFEVIDRIFAILSDKKLYPAMKRIVLCGFSAGGQCVNRYIAVGKMPLASEISTGFAVGNPSTYLYIDNRRLIDGEFRNVEDNDKVNPWFYGMDNRYAYCRDIPVSQVMKNLSSRPTLYFCGTADIGKHLLDVTPAAVMQGKNRYDRFLTFQKYTALFPQWRKAVRFIAVPKIAHSATVFYKNHAIQKWVFGE